MAEVLTQGPPSLPEPLDAEAFYRGYRARLEDKLRHKSSQIARMERLLDDLPPPEQPTFTALLEEAREHRDQIRGELDQLYKILEELDS